MAASRAISRTQSSKKSVGPNKATMFSMRSSRIPASRGDACSSAAAGDAQAFDSRLRRQFQCNVEER